MGYCVFDLVIYFRALISHSFRHLALCLSVRRLSQVVQVDEDDEPPELRRILDRARKQRLLELQVRAAEGDDNGAEEEGTEQRRMSLMGASAEGAGPAVSLFRVTQADGSLQLSLVACTSRDYIAEIGGDELEPEQVRQVVGFDL